MPKPEILVFPLNCIFLRYWAYIFILVLSVWAASSGWMSLKALISRQYPHLADYFNAVFPHFYLTILHPNSYCPANISLQFLLRGLFSWLAVLNMPVLSIHPTISFPPLLQCYSIPFPGIISHILSKHPCLPQQDCLPPFLPPSLAGSVLLQALTCCLCWKKLLAVIQNASFLPLKTFWAISFVLTPVTSLGQESGWDMDRREQSLLYWPTLLGCLPEFIFFSMFKGRC